MARIDVPGSSGTTAEVLAHADDLQVQVVRIAAGGSIPSHAHKVASTYVVLEGGGRFTGPQTRSVSSGDVVSAPAGEAHGWSDVGSEGLRFVSVFSGGGVVDASGGSWDLDYR